MKIKIINTFLIVDICIVIFCYLSGQQAWFINSQIAFFSSLIVVIASMYSYAQMVKAGVKNEIVTASNDELLDKIEDPHSLNDHESHSEQVLEVNREEMPKQVQHDDEILKQVQNDKQAQDDKDEERSISTIEAMKKNKAYVSLYRIGAYAILVLGFLYLQNSKKFHMASYMFGLILPPILMAIVIFWASKISKEK